MPTPCHPFPRQCATNRLSGRELASGSQAVRPGKRFRGGEYDNETPAPSGAGVLHVLAETNGKCVANCNVAEALLVSSSALAGKARCGA